MTTIVVQNLKCGGCANTISKAIDSIEGISNVSVNKDTSEINFSAETEDLIQTVKTKLSQLGYPEVNDKNTLKHKGISFISCAVGRMQSNDSKN